MAEQNSRTIKIAIFVALIVIAFVIGFFFANGYVSYMIQEHPIHTVDPNAKYVWVGDLLARNQTGETLIVGLTYGTGLSSLIVAIYLLASSPFKTGWFKKGLVSSILFGLAPALLIMGYLGYASYLGEVRDWGKTHDSFVFNEYLLEVIFVPACLTVATALITAAIAFLIISIIAITIHFLKKERNQAPKTTPM